MWQLDLDGGGFTALEVAPSNPPVTAGAYRPFIDGLNLWFSDQDSEEVELPLGGGPYPLVDPYGENSFFVDAKWIYFPPATPVGIFGRVPRLAWVDAGLDVIEGNATAVAIDDGWAYVATAGTPPDCTDGTIEAVPLAGGEHRILAGEQHDPIAVALDGQRIYWLNQGEFGCVVGAVPLAGDGALLVVGMDGGQVAALASGLTWPGSLTVAGQWAYWTEDVLTDDVAIQALYLDGGSPMTLATGQPTETAPTLLASGGALFWNDTGTLDAGFKDGRVMEL
ncbi:MAG TPA: hypothetical protein VMB50_06125, partial [Myxococcales bacterium]|nr:hypothetical protein [Myxococcales bacterium]